MQSTPKRVLFFMPVRQQKLDFSCICQNFVVPLRENLGNNRAYFRLRKSRRKNEKHKTKYHEEDTYFIFGRNGRSGDRKGRDGTDLL